jgi:hypothetical protein
MWQTKYLKIWERELIFGRAVKAISSPGVHIPWYQHNLALEVIMKMHALVSKMKQFDKCTSFVCRNNWNGCQIVIYLINNFKILGQQKLELHAIRSETLQRPLNQALYVLFQNKSVAYFFPSIKFFFFTLFYATF